jgi:hypothetical protein
VNRGDRPEQIIMDDANRAAGISRAWALSVTVFKPAGFVGFQTVTERGVGRTGRFWPWPRWGVHPTSLGRTRLAHSWQRLDVARQFRQAVVCGEPFNQLECDLIEAGEGFGLFSGPELIELQ